MPFTGDEDQEISPDAAANLTANFREQMSERDKKGFYFSRKSVETLLKQTGCVGIRVYNGLSDEGEQRLVMVGVDRSENDLYGEGYACMDMAVPCPNQCGEANALNSY